LPVDYRVFKDPRLLGDRHVNRILPTYSDAQLLRDVTRLSQTHGGG